MRIKDAFERIVIDEAKLHFREGHQIMVHPLRWQP